MNQANNHNKNIFVIHCFYYCTKKLHEEKSYTFFTYDFKQRLQKTLYFPLKQILIKPELSKHSQLILQPNQAKLKNKNSLQMVMQN